VAFDEALHDEHQDKRPGMTMAFSTQVSLGCDEVTSTKAMPSNWSDSSDVGRLFMSSWACACSNMSSG